MDEYANFCRGDPEVDPAEVAQELCAAIQKKKEQVGNGKI